MNDDEFTEPMLTLDQLLGVYGAGGGGGLGVADGGSPPPAFPGAGVRGVGGGAAGAAMGGMLAGLDGLARLPEEGETLPEVDVASFVGFHHDVVISTAVGHAMDSAERASSRQQRAREADHWRRERRELLEALDVTFDGGAGKGFALALPSVAAERGGGGGGAGGGVALAASSSSSSSPSAAGSTSMSPTMRAHALVVRRINEAAMFPTAAASGGFGGGGYAGVWPALELERVARASLPPLSAGWGEHHASFAKLSTLLRCWAVVRAAVGEVPEGPSSGGGGASRRFHAVGPRKGRFADLALLPDGDPAKEV